MIQPRIAIAPPLSPLSVAPPKKHAPLNRHRRSATTGSGYWTARITPQAIRPKPPNRLSTNSAPNQAWV
jgi:hypothetical protein